MKMRGSPSLRILVANSGKSRKMYKWRECCEDRGSRRQERVRASPKKEKAMSLKPQPIGPIPEETARIARAAYPKGNIYLKLRDAPGTIYEDEQFAHLLPQRGQPAAAPWRLALVCVMQFLEGLSDRQAADAVRGRLE